MVKSQSCVSAYSAAPVLVAHARTRQARSIGPSDTVNPKSGTSGLRGRKGAFGFRHQKLAATCAKAAPSREQQTAKRERRKRGRWHRRACNADKLRRDWKTSMQRGSISPSGRLEPMTR